MHTSLANGCWPSPCYTPSPSPSPATHPPPGHCRHGVPGNSHLRQGSRDSRHRRSATEDRCQGSKLATEDVEIIYDDATLVYGNHKPHKKVLNPIQRQHTPYSAYATAAVGDANSSSDSAQGTSSWYPAAEDGNAAARTRSYMAATDPQHSQDLDCPFPSPTSANFNEHCQARSSGKPNVRMTNSQYAPPITAARLTESSSSNQTKYNTRHSNGVRQQQASIFERSSKIGGRSPSASEQTGSSELTVVCEVHTQRSANHSCPRGCSCQDNHSYTSSRDNSNYVTAASNCYAAIRQDYAPYDTTNNVSSRLSRHHSMTSPYDVVVSRGQEHHSTPLCSHCSCQQHQTTTNHHQLQQVVSTPQTAPMPRRTYEANGKRPQQQQVAPLAAVNHVTTVGNLSEIPDGVLLQIFSHLSSDELAR